MYYSVQVIAEKSQESLDSVAEILSRAFDSAAASLSQATAELILKARLPEPDLQRVEDLLEQKREVGLTPEQEATLRDYLEVDCLLTILKSKARRAIGNSVIA